MNPTEQAIWVVKLALYIAPPALYFVMLGLVNSQGRCHVISGRSDWLALMLVFFPVLIWPTLWLMELGRWLLVLLLSAGWAVFLWLSTPDELASLVIYNTTRCRCRRAVQRTLAGLNVPFREDRGTLILPQQDVRIKFNSVTVLRNVTLHFEGPLYQHRVLLERIRGELAARLARIQTTPGLSAPCLLLAGTVMLLIPLSMMVQNIDVFVQLVTDLLAA